MKRYWRLTGLQEKKKRVEDSHSGLSHSHSNILPGSQLLRPGSLNLTMNYKKILVLVLVTLVILSLLVEVDAGKKRKRKDKKKNNGNNKKNGNKKNGNKKNGKGKKSGRADHIIRGKINILIGSKVRFLFHSKYYI